MSSTDRERADVTKTPQTPGEQFDLPGFKDTSKSPGFSYSCRAMFGDPGDTTEVRVLCGTDFNVSFSSHQFGGL